MQDGLGSTVGLTDNSGALTNTYTYDVYGAGKAANPLPAPQATFTFDGEQTDASGLIYLRARYDDPGTGRFVTQDPSVTVATDTGSLNRYAYGEGNPVMVTDPFGLCSKWPPSNWGDCPQKAVEKAAAAAGNFVTPNCIGAALGVGALALSFAVPPGGAAAAALLTFYGGPAWTYGAWNNGSTLKSKEGNSWSKELAGTGLGSDFVAFESSLGGIALSAIGAETAATIVPQVGIGFATAVAAAQCGRDVFG